MNRIITCTIFVLLCSLSVHTTHAQNMVPNGDFESYTICPSLSSEIADCTGWTEYSPSADYFNSCSTGNQASVPTNWTGTQNAASGNGYAGIATSMVSGSYREAITCNITPLIVGRAYEVSMSLSLAEQSMYGANSTGVLFYKNRPTTESAVTIGSITPQISYASYGPITDKNNWVRVTAVFTADSAYDHLTIAGFGPVSSMTFSQVATSGAGHAYYYIDSVVVKPLFSSGIKGNQQNKSPNIYPTPTRDKLIIEDINRGTTIQLMDVLGRILISQTAIEEKEQLNISQLIPGNYLLQLRDRDNNTMTVKITKE